MSEYIRVTPTSEGLHTAEIPAALESVHKLTNPDARGLSNQLNPFANTAPPTFEFLAISEGKMNQSSSTTVSTTQRISKRSRNGSRRSTRKRLTSLDELNLEQNSSTQSNTHRTSIMSDSRMEDW